MAQGVAWIGGTGSFDDPSDWTSDASGNPAGSPATPPGAGMRAEYLAAGTVSFAGQSNGEADINNAGMVFDLSGGGYTLTGIGGNQALQFDVGEVESQSPTLTVTGANTLKTNELNAANAAAITVTGGATLEVAGTADTFLFTSAVVSDGGTFAFDSGLNFTQFTGFTASLSVDDGTVTAGADGANFAGGTVVTVQDKGAINVNGSVSFDDGSATFSGGSNLTATSMSFGTGSATFSGGSKLAATSAIIAGDSATSAPAQVSLTDAGTAGAIQGALFVGAAGAGTLTLDNGASLTVAGNLQIGFGSVAGSVNLAGAGSMLSVGGNLVIDSGTLTVDENSTLAVTGDILIGDSGATGSSADATSSPATTAIAGTVILNSDSKPATLRDACIIGDNEKGTLKIESNYVLNANKNTITIGSQKAGKGQLTVDGDGAELTNVQDLVVGANGSGSVLIENFGSVHASALSDGSYSSQGTGKIAVSDGRLYLANDAAIAETASGSLTVENKGFVSIGSDLVVGPYGGAAGTVAVSSNSGIGVAATPGGNGFVTIGKGGRVSLNCSHGAYSAKTMIAGGTLFLKRTGAEGSSGIFFGAGGGMLSLANGVTVSEYLDGFGSGDSIQLIGVTANKESYSENSSGVTLTLKNGNAPVETLHFAGSYTPASFGLAEVGGNAVVSFNPSAVSAASIQEQIFNSALLSDSPAYHPLDAFGGRGSAIGSATSDLWSVGHAPGPGG